MNLAEIAARLEEISVQVEALSDVALEAGDNSEETLAQIEALDSEFAGLKAKQERQEKIQARVDEIVASRVAPSAPAIEAVATIEPELNEEKKEMIPAQAKAFNSKFFASNEDAYVSGQALLAQAGNRKAKDFMAAQSIGTDSEGGYTVPTPLAASLINLLEEVGVARKVCKRIVMSASTWTVPKLLTHASVSYPAEAGAISDSDVSFGQVQLVATKVASLVKMSTEVNEDSIISMMDTVVQSMAYSIATAEDQNLFLGVAGGINTAGIAGDASVADTAVANAGALALTDLTACTVSLGNPVVGARNEWYMNPVLFHGQIRDLLNAAGGNTMSDWAGGARPSLLGYPVNFVNVMDASGAGKMGVVFGDASLGCYFGDRRAVNFRTLTELYANTDQVGVQATSRVDIKVANPEVLAKITFTA